MNFGSGRNTKRMASETLFSQFVGLGNLKISGRFRAQLPPGVPGTLFLDASCRDPGAPEKSTDLPSHPSSFRVPSESRSTRSIPRELHKSHRASHRFLQFFPGQGTFAVLVILLQIVNHYLRRTVPVSLSLVKGCKRHGHMKLGPVLSSSGLNFLEMLYQFILRVAVVLQFAIIFFFLKKK